MKINDSSLEINNDVDKTLYETMFPLANIYNVTFVDNFTNVFYDGNSCVEPVTDTYNTSFGILIAVPEWEAVTTIAVLTVIIVGTIFGNILVILGVFTHKPLRIVQNFFIVSLAAADLAVAILVMPFNVAYSILGRWEWGIHLCKLWLTCDIMCCTSSILNLCAIALDRYWAITDPIDYANKRTLKRVVLLIAGVWVMSLIISSPPLLGWNDWPETFSSDTPCQLTSERSYVVYSSLGSFFIPLFIMTIVYIKIFTATKTRLRRRAMVSRIIVTKLKNSDRVTHDVERQGSANSDSNANEDNDSDSSGRVKRCQRKEFMEIKKNLFMPLLVLGEQLSRKKMDSELATDSTTCSAESCSPGRGLSAVTFRRSSQRKSKRSRPLLASVDKKGDVLHQFIEEKQRISLSKERRAARTLGIIMGVFVVCWLPFFLMYVILPFCVNCCPQDKLINFITWLGYINSTVNPLIYTIFNMDFRKAFQKILGFKSK